MFGVVYVFKNKGKNGSGHVDLPLSFHQPKESPKKSIEPTWARNMKPYFSGLVKQKKRKRKTRVGKKQLIMVISCVVLIVQIDNESQIKMKTNKQAKKIHR